ncbi:hypothetical protein L3X38_036258 [Prunus dulcis]|uniref:Transposable element protein n=1 Tax=Prunus dulcis TaxID=3755 RepID=A0AAD4YPB1_PRUDU|nr:hypothetical protein L3X38_036258 [Prunus dulcis]
MTISWSITQEELMLSQDPLICALRLEVKNGTRTDYSVRSDRALMTDGQSERTIQTLEDMLRACALQFRGDWDEKLPLMEFAYNNSCQTSIEMSPFDALCGKQCRTPLYEDEVGTRGQADPQEGPSGGPASSDQDVLDICLTSFGDARTMGARNADQADYGPLNPASLRLGLTLCHQDLPGELTDYRELTDIRN